MGGIVTKIGQGLGLLPDDDAYAVDSSRKPLYTKIIRQMQPRIEKGFAQAQDAREGQAALTQRLIQGALGKAPSLARAEVDRATEESIRGLGAALKSASAGIPGLARRQYLQQSGELRKDAAEQAALARLREIGAAQQAASALRGADIDAATAAGNVGGRFAQAAEGVAGTEAAGRRAQAENQAGFIRSLIGGGAALLASSDKNVKKNIKKANKDTASKIMERYK